MVKLDGEKPQAVVSQPDQYGREGEYRFSAADFVMVRGSKIHLWVNGIHFVEDSDGDVQAGQYFYVKDPGMGVMVSVIESVNEAEKLAIVQHLAHWNDGELNFPASTETWNKSEIRGDHARTMGDASDSTFLRRNE